MLSLEHSAILSTFIKLPLPDVIKSVLSIFEWPLMCKTGYTVTKTNSIYSVKLYAHAYLHTRRYTSG